MNILLIASDNSKTSGAFLCMAELCRGLQESYGVNVKVVLPYAGDGKQILDSFNIRSLVVKSCTWAVPMEWSRARKIKFTLKMLVYNIPAIHKIRQIIREEKIDIVHINTSWTYPGAVAAKLENKVLVWHIRELLQQQQREIAFQKLGYKLMKKSDVIIPVSAFVGAVYREIFGDLLHVVYDGVEEERFYEDREILQGDTIKLLCMGLLNDQKGQMQAVQAVKALRDNGYSNIDFSIVGRGEGTYRSVIENYVQENRLESLVHVYDATSSPEEYYKKSDIFLMNSRAEAFGRTTAEAMLSGCLVIGANSGATVELISDGETGLLYDHGDIDALANAIKFAMNNKAAAMQIANKGQKNAMHNFTQIRNTEGIREQYNILMAGKQGK